MGWLAFLPMLVKSVGIVNTIVTSIREVIEGSHGDQKETIRKIEAEIDSLKASVAGIRALEEAEDAELNRAVPRQ